MADVEHLHSAGHLVGGIMVWRRSDDGRFANQAVSLPVKVAVSDPKKVEKRDNRKINRPNSALRDQLSKLTTLPSPAPLLLSSPPLTAVLERHNVNPRLAYIHTPIPPLSQGHP